MGQNCTANSRLIVHKSIHDELLPKILDRIRDWRTGDPLDPKNALGAIVSKEQFDKIMGFIEAAKQQGAELLTSSEPSGDNDGFFIPPAIFGNVFEPNI